MLDLFYLNSLTNCPKNQAISQTKSNNRREESIDDLILKAIGTCKVGHPWIIWALILCLCSCSQTFSTIWLFLLIVLFLIYLYNKTKKIMYKKQPSPIQENYSFCGRQPRFNNYTTTTNPPSSTACQPKKVCLNTNMCTPAKTVGADGSSRIYTLASLSGKPNPKTLHAPIVTAKSHDLDFWRANEFVTHSHINEQLRIDDYQSGYSSTACGNLAIDHTPNLQRMGPLSKGGACAKIKYGEEIESQDFVEGYEYPYQQTKPYDLEMKPIKTEGDLNDVASYDPKRLSYNRPSNLPGGVCNESKQLADYNRNLFTSIVQPGIYKKHDINEQQTSNYGISHTQQFPQVTCDRTEKGELIYTEHDVRLSAPVERQPNMSVIEDVNYATVYDPRFTGYGPNYRAYLDDMTGQPRYFYDDVNAVRMPNYITRSNIDHLSFADKYGPIDNEQVDTAKIREHVNNAWFDNSSMHRIELQERLMRKFNTKEAQRKMAPINTMSGRR